MTGSATPNGVSFSRNGTDAWKRNGGESAGGRLSQVSTLAEGSETPVPVQRSSSNGGLRLGGVGQIFSAIGEVIEETGHAVSDGAGKIGGVLGATGDLLLARMEHRRASKAHELTEQERMLLEASQDGDSDQASERCA